MPSLGGSPLVAKLRLKRIAMIVVAFLLTSCDNAPPTRTPAAAQPQQSIQWSAPVPPPPLVDKTSSASVSVDRFISWAIEAKNSQKPIAREALKAAARNSEIAKALFEKAVEYRHKDPVRSFFALALLGEMRSPSGLKYLTAFLAMPSTPISQLVGPEGSIATTAVSPSSDWEQHLVAKATDGLAYMKAAEADAHIFTTMNAGNTLYLRAMAVDAYLWNHQDSEEAQKQVDKYVRPEEAWMRDRFRRDDDDTGESFDAKVQQWVTKHPQLMPPPLKPSSNPPKKRPWYKRFWFRGDDEEKSSLSTRAGTASFAQQLVSMKVSANAPQCPQVATPIDVALFNADGGATWGGYGQAGWRDFIAQDFSVTGDDWGGDGWPDLGNVITPYGMMANSDMLITYGLNTATGFTFHDPYLDYFQLAEGHGGRFKDDIFHTINTGNGTLIARWVWEAGPSPNIIIDYCGQFTADPTSRAATFMHESWHGWQWRYHWSINPDGSGHLPIDSNPSLPKGNCIINNGCDYYTLHKVSLFPPGQLEYSTTGPPNQKMHSPNQVAAEFLCDLAQRPNPGLPLSVIAAAQNNSNILVQQRFLNPVPLGCSNRRPF